MYPYCPDPSVAYNLTELMDEMTSGLQHCAALIRLYTHDVEGNVSVRSLSNGMHIDTILDDLLDRLSPCLESATGGTFVNIINVAGWVAAALLIACVKAGLTRVYR